MPTPEQQRAQLWLINQLKKSTISPTISSKFAIFVLFCVSCCGAGTAADTQMVTRMISSQIELHRLNTGRKPRVIAALRLIKQHLFKYQVCCRLFLVSI